MTEIICSGFGGQGVLVAGMILADSGMEDGKNVTWYPSYGAEMRGGTAGCNVVISDEEIAKYPEHSRSRPAVSNTPSEHISHLQLQR